MFMSLLLSRFDLGPQLMVRGLFGVLYFEMLPVVRCKETLSLPSSSPESVCRYHRIFSAALNVNNMICQLVIVAGIFGTNFLNKNFVFCILSLNVEGLFVFQQISNQNDHILINLI